MVEPYSTFEIVAISLVATACGILWITAFVIGPFK